MYKLDVVRVASSEFYAYIVNRSPRIQFSADRIVDQEIPSAFPEDASFVDQVGSVHQFERLA